MNRYIGQGQIWKPIYRWSSLDGLVLSLALVVLEKWTWTLGLMLGLMNRWTNERTEFSDTYIGPC